MKKIRVAFFAEILIEDLDGAVRTMFHLINRINKTRFDYLFVYGVGPAQIGDFESVKIPSIALPVNATYSLALPVLAQSRLKRKLREFTPDVVHIATPSLLGNFGLNYATQNRLPVITIYHTHFISYLDYYLKYTPFLIDSIRNRMAESHKAFYNRCDKIYVPSVSIRNELVAIGINGTKARIWKRGIDTALFNPSKRNDSLMQRLTGNNNPSVLFASRLVWEKNLETLFGIYDGLQNGDAPVNLIIAGDGTARQDCELRMPNAFFLGSTDQDYLATLYASADVFIFPSVSEAYGNVVAEAMASGLPCVIADGGGSKDFVEHGVNGFKCQPYNAADYVEKINLLLQDSTLRSRFASRGLIGSRLLNWDNLALEYFNDVIALADNSLSINVQSA
ncbi:glycosyltransferase family 4 protein [Mucilaginibacter glaciei]|uniref:Glycosyltransferase family 1 protein n=1 Tax=Mucilaginibacter glaciei TaxID=2772109 RepID=A0A926P106_9SPHI|nr:glycosyltransferase family 1 protein [Mucilaginibacter glaciei]MBD1395344.1 glycosyltransferase family 1 protein [Mucilaginibacter glaciei]